jgi:hypothetical protein
MQTSARPDGEEGLFSSQARSNRFVLRKALVLEAGTAIVVDIRREAATAVSDGTIDATRMILSASAAANGSSPSVSASFPLLAERARFVLPLEASSRIASITVEARGNDLAFRIESIASAPSFKGIEQDSSGLKVSGLFSLAKGSGFEDFSITRPMAGLRRENRPGILLDYTGAPPGSVLRLEVLLHDGRRLSYNMRTHPAGTRCVLDEALVPPDTDLATLRVPENLSIRAFYAAELPVDDYSLADLGRVLMTDPPADDYSLYRWDMLPSVLIFDFKDYEAQDRYLKRIAFFVEKIGYRGSLLKDEQLAPLHGWNAHDYRAEDLAAFFQAAKDKSFPLGAAENKLEGLLVGAGIIKDEGGRISPGNGALISIARGTTESLRWTFLVHESMHGIFFTDPEYRAFAQSLWASIGPEEKWFWKTYLGWAGYDPGWDYLIGNEFQAYLLQQPVSLAEDYFSKHKSAELLEKHPELAEKMGAYMDKYGVSFAQHARQLESWLSRKYGVQAGRSVFLTRH